MSLLVCSIGLEVISGEVFVTTLSLNIRTSRIYIFHPNGPYIAGQSGSSEPGNVVAADRLKILHLRVL